MLNITTSIILVYFFILGTAYAILFLLSIRRIIGKYQEVHFSHINKVLVSQDGLAVTVLMSVRNNQTEVLASIKSILNNDYQNTSLIVVNDGSSDDTLNILIKAYDLEKTTRGLRYLLKTSSLNAIYQSKLYPRLLLIDKNHEQEVNSAADGLNLALNFCRTPICITIDSDTVIAKDAITQLVYRYLSSANCIAVGGDIYIPDEFGQHGKIPQNKALGVQVVEYLRSFIYGREMWSAIGGALCHSGAMTLFETNRLIELGGFDRDNFSYDAEIIMRFHDDALSRQLPYRIRYAPAAIAWSSQPTSIKGLWKQRNRWQRGIWRSVCRHLHLFMNPKYGKVGLLGMPFYVLFETIGPCVEGVAYLTLVYALIFHQINFYELAWFIGLAWGYLYILTIASVFLNYLTLNQYHLKKDLFKLMWLNFIDVIFYRPLRSFDALCASLQYFYNKLRGKPL